VGSILARTVTPSRVVTWFVGTSGAFGVPFARLEEPVWPLEEKPAEDMDKIAWKK